MSIPHAVAFRQRPGEPFCPNTSLERRVSRRVPDCCGTRFGSQLRPEAFSKRSLAPPNDPPPCPAYPGGRIEGVKRLSNQWSNRQMKPAAVISSFRQDVFASMGAGHLHHESAFDLALRLASEFFASRRARFGRTTISSRCEVIIPARPAISSLNVRLGIASGLVVVGDLPVRRCRAGRPRR
jgi:hypothetical protein